jgi:peroxiredoxin
VTLDSATVSPIRKSDLLSWGYVVLLGVSLAGNVFLAHSRASLLRTVNGASSAARLQFDSKIGSKIDYLTVANLGGEKTTLPMATGKTTILYVFSPTCHWCAANYESIVSLATQRRDEYSFVGLSVSSDVESLNKYLDKHPYPFQSFSEKSPADLASIGFSGTPQTIVINGSGIIEKNWRGAYGKGTEVEVSHYFAVSLPDISNKFDF